MNIMRCNQLKTMRIDSSAEECVDKYRMISNRNVTDRNRSFTLAVGPSTGSNKKKSEGKALYCTIHTS